MLNLGKLKAFAPASVLAVALLATACTETGDTRNETESRALDGVTRATVVLEMGAGDLNVAGGAEGMLDAEFTYNIEDWEPRVDWQVNGDEGQLEIDQSGTSSINPLDLDDIENEWNIKLSDEIPLSMDVDLGFGDSSLTLGSLAVTDLNVDTGAGDTTVDLAGEWANDLQATIDAGAGSRHVAASGGCRCPRRD